MARPRLELLLELMDRAFSGFEHSLLNNLATVEADSWSKVPEGGERSVQEIIRHVGMFKFMYANHAFRDGGDARQKVEEKRDLVCGEDHHGGAVVVREHRTVCFIWMSTDEGSAATVMDRLQDHLHIPEHRIIAPQ